MVDKIKVDIEVEEREALRSIEKFIKKMDSAEKEANSLEDQVKKTGKSISNSFSQKFGISKLGDGLKGLAGNFLDLSSVMNVFSGVALANLVTKGFEKLTEAIGFAVDEFLEFEKAVIGVKKTTGLSGKELEGFIDEIQQLSKEIPVSQNELLKLAEVAGQLGVSGKADLLKFTEVVSQLNVATDLAGEEGAKSLVRILNVTGEGIQNIDRFASAIVTLGNNVAASESEIVRMATEVSRATSVFEIGAANAAGISAALKELGVQAELGGSQVGLAFGEIAKVISEGGSKLEKFAQLSGMTSDELRQSWAEDNVETFKIFLNAVGSVDGGAAAIIKTFESFGLTGRGVQKVLVPLSQNLDILTKSLNLSNEGFKSGTAAADEAAEAYNTLGSQISRTWNIIKTVAVDAIEPLADATKEGLKSFNDFADGLNTVEEITPKINELTNEMDALDKKIKDVQANPQFFRGSFSPEQLAWQRDELEKNRDALIQLRNEMTETQRASQEGELLIRPSEGDATDFTKFNFEIMEEKKKYLVKEVADVKEAEDTKKAVIEESAKAKLDLEAFSNEQKAILDTQLALEREEADLKAKEIREGLQEEEVARLNALQYEKIGIISAGELQKTQLIENEDKKRLAQEKILADTSLKTQREMNRQKLEDAKRVKEAEKGSIMDLFDFEKNTQGSRAQMFKSSLSTIATLQNSGSKKLFFVGKAAAVSQATIDGIAAVQKALASLPPPANFAMAALVGTATAANVANIASQKPPGFEFGGFVGGTSFTGDSQVIRANSGERVLTTSEQRNIVDGVASGTVSGNNQTVSAINELKMAIMDQPIMITIGEEEFARVARNAKTSGYL